MTHLLRDLSSDHYWDAIFLQEYCFARPEGLQIVDGHLLLIGESTQRKCTALVVHKRWIPHVTNIDGKCGLATAHLHVGGATTVKLISAHFDPTLRNTSDFESEIERLERAMDPSKDMLIGIDLNTEINRLNALGHVGEYAKDIACTHRSRRFIQFLIKQCNIQTQQKSKHAHYTHRNVE